jgi:hypothetical protein
MSDKNGNGHVDEEELALTTKEESPKALLNKGSLQGLFSTPEGHDNARLLLTPGKDIEALAMRSSPPSKRFLLAMNISLQRCIEHNNLTGIAFYRGILAGLPGVKDKRAQMFSDTLTGAQTFARGGGDGMIQKAKKWAFGD